MGQEKVDAWINAIRALARQHNVAHRLGINDAVKEARLATKYKEPIPVPAYIDRSFELAVDAGIPDEEIRAVYVLIFG